MRTNIDRETQWKAVKGMRRSDEMEKSKWHGEPCPASDEGVLRDGTRLITQEYKGHNISLGCVVHSAINAVRLSWRTTQLKKQRGWNLEIK
jgi:hypothetical protein